MKNIYLIISILGLTILSSCEPLEVSPEYLLDDSSAIIDPQSAEFALIGVYDGLTRNFGSSDVFWNALTSYQGVEAKASGFVGPGFFGAYEANNIPSTDNLLTDLYSTGYQLIGDANQLIKKVEALDANLFDGSRKNEILGEAYFLRGFTYFRLLRSFGQFWDTSSPYGLILRTEPATDVSPIPRNTVAETYDQIISDLDFAIANAPDYSDALQANNLAAKAFKSLALLHRGQGSDYSEAATIALEVINNSSGADLEANYADVFNKEFTSKEVLFTSFYNTTNEDNGNGFWWGPLVSELSPYYLNILSGDPRQAVVTIFNPFAPPGTSFLNAKFYDITGGDITGENNAAFFLRLAELYLVRAEALARSGASASEVKTALNVTQNRAGSTVSVSDDINVLLDEIRLEKIKELGTENGSTWYDLIRYSELDGVDISAIKSSVVSPNQYIFPFPINAITVGGGIIEQNPGY